MSKDALGNSLEIGKKYGHSQRASGSVQIVVGVLEEILEDGKVLLSEVKRGSGLYNSDVKEMKYKRGKVTLISNSIFPIHNDIRWTGGENG